MTGPLPMPVTVVMAAVMGATALYCAVRLVVAPLTGRVSDRTADLLHVVMGAVMAASLLGVLNRRWDLLWVLAFLAAGLWFARAAVVATAGSGWRAVWSGSRHGLQHGSACLAMVVMLTGASTSYAAGPRAAGGPGPMRAMPGMSMTSLTSGSGAGGLLVLTLVVGVLALAVGDARLVTAHPRAGSAPGGRPMLAPRCASGCRVAMGATMALALLTML